MMASTESQTSGRGLFSLLGRVAGGIAALGGWARWGLALAAGALSCLALPPFYLVLLLAVSLPVLIWCLDGAKSLRGAFAIGWGFGTGFFAAGLYWISNALLVDAEHFGWLVPFALAGFGLGLGIFHGLVTLVAWRLRAQGVGRILVFAALWTLFEILRGWIFTGFPWNLIGSVWADSPSMLQSTASIGSYGLSLVTVMVFSSPALLGWSGLRGRGRRASALVVGAAFGLLIALWAGGQARLSSPEAENTPMVDGVWLRLVQPNIAQADKWKPELRMTNLRDYLALSLSPSHRAPTHVIWGETAVPYSLDGNHDAELRAALGEALAATDPATPLPLLITGAIRRTPQGQQPFHVWNSMLALDAQGEIHGWYDKAHLVPFGEYVPLRGLLPIDKITPGAVDFSAGHGPVTLSLPGLPAVSPLICYEVIFPGSVVLPPSDGQRPAWMLNLTNDGWYGLSTGPYQHYATARMRAAEEGIPLVRVANTGISAIVDPWGREVVRLDLGQDGFIDGPLPQPIAPTLFAVVGIILPLGISILTLCLGLVLSRRQTRSSPH